MKKITDSREFEGLEARARAYKWSSLRQGGWSEWGMLFRFLVIICRLLEKNRRSGKKRKASDWSIFAGQQMRKGKTLKEAAEMWKIKKS